MINRYPYDICIYKVLPTVDTIIDLLEYSLSRGNGFEARLVVLACICV